MKKSLIFTILILFLAALALGLGVLSKRDEPGLFQETEKAATFKNINFSSGRTVTTDKDGIKRSVDQKDILPGGPRKDGIPSIDNPRFVSAVTAGEYLKDDDIGLMYKSGDTIKFYPYNILAWHEIVNDELDGNPILVTYCPLCETGIIFDPVIDGKRSLFGTSGSLWESNLLMYDRNKDSENFEFDFRKESLWSQVLGEAVVGPRSGESLNVLGSQTVTFGSISKKYPEVLVLSKDTGYSKNYSITPYQGYSADEDLYFDISNLDERIHAKTFVYGIQTVLGPRAYIDEDITSEGIRDFSSGVEIIVKRDSAGIVTITEGGREVSFISGFWFSWAGAHPETTLFEDKK